MSIEAMAVVLHHSRAKGTDKLVLLGIANHAGDGGAWPTVVTLARYANVSERTVQRSIESLVMLGEIQVYLQAGGTRNVAPGHRPNRYDVLVACPATCDRSWQHRPLHLDEPALWISGVTPTSPGDARVTPGVTPTSPGGVTPTSPKPSLEPTSTTGSGSVTGPRASCSICSRSFEECTARAATSGHDYVPVKRKASDVLTRIHEHYPQEAS